MKSATILIMLLLVTSACTTVITTPETGKTPQTQESLATQDIIKINSVEHLKAIIDNSQNAEETVFSSGIARAAAPMMEGDFAVVADAAMPAMAEQASGGSAKATDFSTTNIQVQGVDEADFVKNDGKYIYVLSGNELVIANAYPAENAEILSETTIEGDPITMFLADDKAFIFTRSSEPFKIIPKYEYEPRDRYEQVTKVIVYDMSDKEDPEEIEEFSVKGNYFQARMTQGKIYFIAKESVYYYNNWIDLPVVMRGGEIDISPEIYYIDNPERNYNFHTIVSLDVNNLNLDAKTYMMGYSNNMYMSQDNIYITYMKNFPREDYQEEQEKRFEEAILTKFPASIRNQINTNNWEESSQIIESYYESLSRSELEDLLEKIQESVQEYDVKRATERQRTVIQKISVKNINHVATGEVPGTVLNQFSMDEHEQTFRLATTTNLWTRTGRVTHNNVYVMDEDLDIIGKIEKIAPDESIYSTRFMQDRLYMVTFERVDPLFVIDLSNPQNPKILGELKIPGYSDYLHPYDENHIIGIGKETEENSWGGISTGGIKISLFDVSDVKNPRQVDKYEIGGSGADSEALREHKAFLFDKDKELLVIPIREPDQGWNKYPYQYRVWQGAYVFDIDENGFRLRGKVQHYNGELDRYYYWNGPYAVKRSLYMDDTLYTISNSKIMAHDLKTLAEQAELRLPYRANYYPRYY